MLSIGTYYPMGPDGRVLNRTDLDSIPDKWRRVLPEIMATYERHLGPGLHSVWLRGSVAAGHPVEGISDLDSFALVHPESYPLASTWNHPPWAAEVSTQLVQTHPFIHEVEFVLLPCSLELIQAHGHLWPMMQTQALCIQGENPFPGLPAPFLADLKRNGRWILSDWEALLANNRDDRTIRTFIKTFIRGAFEEVMEREGKYATDFYPCIQSLLVYRPDWEVSWVEMVDIFCRPNGRGRRLYDIASGMVTQVLEKKAF